MRPVTLYSGPWADLTLDEFLKKAAGWGYDGVELACCPNHLDIAKASKDKKYCKVLLDKLACRGLNLSAVNQNRISQLVCDPDNDVRTDAICPKKCAGNPEAKRKWAVEQMRLTVKAAVNLGVEIVTGVTGSPVWHLLFALPAPTPESIQKGFDFAAEMWHPILDIFEDYELKFALKVQPAQLAFDMMTAKRLLETLDYREEIGFNFDPAQLAWQGIRPTRFIQDFPDRIFNVVMNDVAVTLDGRAGLLGGHIAPGGYGRGWDFRGPGHGQINFEEIVRELNRIEYDGPLSVSWEDPGMTRDCGAKDACEFIRRCDFAPSSTL